MDGPKVEPPKRRGFGTMLLEKVVAVQCDADVGLQLRSRWLSFHHGAAAATH